MMAYGGDVCSGYVASYEYESDAWSWAGQSWGGYPQVQYDVGTWGYQQQEVQGWSTHEEPKVGAELLTELRLAELKRLIDRDSEALKRSESEDATDPRDTGQASAGAAVEASVAPEPGEGVLLQGGDALVEAALKPHTQPSDDVSDAASTQEPKPLGKPKAPSSGSEVDVVARVEAMMPQASPEESPRGLEARQEQCHVALASFEPESRVYGELPVREGDEIFVSSDPVDGWIFGQRRGAEPDEGWLPASALGLGAAEEPAAEDERAAAAVVAQEPPVQRQRRARGRGAGEGGRGGSAGRRTGAGQQPQQPQQQQQQQATAAGPKRHAQQSRKADHSRSEQQQSQAPSSADRTAGGSLEQQPWHHHGNWWSKQRHLKPQDIKEAEPRQQWSPAHQSGKAHAGGGARGAAHGTSGRKEKVVEEDPGAEESEDGAPALAPGGGGGGGRGRGGRSRPMDRGPPRARPQLSLLLDRLQKPLVAPKPPSGK